MKFQLKRSQGYITNSDIPQNLLTAGTYPSTISNFHIQTSLWPITVTILKTASAVISQPSIVQILIKEN